MALKIPYPKTQLFSMLNFKTFSLIVAANFVLAACDNSIPTEKYNSSPVTSISPSSTPEDPIDSSDSLSSMPAGEYLIRKVWYDERSGEYKIEYLSNSTAVNYHSKQSNTKLAPLTAKEIAAEKKSFAKKSSDGLTLYLAKSFKISFIPTEAETTETEAENTEADFETSAKQIPWSPFTGNQISSTPQFYFPPVYNNTSSLSGYSSSGKSYSSSLNAYTAKYQTVPRSVTNQSSGNNSISKTSSGSNIGSSSSTKSGGSSSVSSGGSTSRGGFGSSGGSSSSS